MDPQTALTELQTPLQVSIVKLASPYLSLDENQPNKRASNASSSDGRDNATPSMLAADLAHYQELFSKLRFSYVEQVTKERFLRAITADSPEFVDASENAELEQKLRVDKDGLKERKQEVREMVKELEEQGRSLASRYENIQLQTQRLETLPTEIRNLEENIAALRQAQGPKSDNPSLSLPLQPTQQLVSEREDQLADMERQIEALQSALPHKQAQIAAMQDEVNILNAKKIRAVDEAKEARRRRENGGGVGDELEERGRWLRGVETGLRTMLEA